MMMTEIRIYWFPVEDCMHGVDQQNNITGRSFEFWNKNSVMPLLT